jgi:D-Tyr-tRNAtyr deacylase
MNYLMKTRKINGLTADKVKGTISLIRNKNEIVYTSSFSLRSERKRKMDAYFQKAKTLKNTRDIYEISVQLDN